MNRVRMGPDIEIDQSFFFGTRAVQRSRLIAAGFS